MESVLPAQSRDLEGEELTLKFSREEGRWNVFVSDAGGQFGAGAHGATPALAVQSLFEFLARVPDQCPWRFAPQNAAGENAGATYRRLSGLEVPIPSAL